MLVVNKGCQ